MAWAAIIAAVGSIASALISKKKTPKISVGSDADLNTLREMINQYGGQSSDRLYDIARNRISADSYQQAQQMGQSLMRTMNARGMLGSGFSSQGLSDIYQGAQQQQAKSLADLESQKIVEQLGRKQNMINMFQNYMALVNQRQAAAQGLALNANAIQNDNRALAGSTAATLASIFADYMQQKGQGGGDNKTGSSYSDTTPYMRARQYSGSSQPWQNNPDFD